jgi:hypothetical protein
LGTIAETKQAASSNYHTQLLSKVVLEIFSSRFGWTVARKRIGVGWSPVWRGRRLWQALLLAEASLVAGVVLCLSGPFITAVWLQSL